jgi:hypothetical protein
MSKKAIVFCVLMLSVSLFACNQEVRIMGCDPENGVHWEGNTCLPNGYSVEAVCDTEGVHVENGMCVADGVEIPTQTECGQCTYEFIDEDLDLRECRVDPLCEQVPPGPDNCGSGTKWNEETQECVLVPTDPSELCDEDSFFDYEAQLCRPKINNVILVCEDNDNYCESIGCSPPDPWIYSSSHNAPTCTCLNSAPQLIVNPTCCGKGEYVPDDKGTECITPRFNPYDKETEIVCWTREDTPEGCENPGRWMYDGDQLPYFQCEGDNLPIERPLCCSMNSERGFCTGPGFDPYHWPVLPDECEVDDDCYDDDPCTLGFCEDGHCEDFNMYNDRACEGDTPFSELEDCVCWDGKPTRYECYDAGNSCEQHVTDEGPCQSPEPVLFFDDLDGIFCDCPAPYGILWYADMLCVHKDYVTGEEQDFPHLPHAHCVYDSQCHDFSPSNECAYPACKNGQCTMLQRQHGRTCEGEGDELCFCYVGMEVNCREDEHCIDDDDPCTRAVCDVNCEQVYVGDGERCAEGICICVDGDPIYGVVCEQDVDCLDSLPCTMNSCESGICHYNEMPLHAECNRDEMIEGTEGFDCVCLENQREEMVPGYSFITAIERALNQDQQLHALPEFRALWFDIAYFHPLGTGNSIDIRKIDLRISTSCPVTTVWMEAPNRMTEFSRNSYLDPDREDITIRMTTDEPFFIDSGDEMYLELYVDTSACTGSPNHLQVELVKILDAEDNVLLAPYWGEDSIFSGQRFIR